MKELLYKGSTKDVFHVSGEELLFKFTNRYSVFDYGEMPDLINGKGISTAQFASKIYRRLENEVNIKTHFLKNGDSPDELIVKKYFVPRDFNSDTFYYGRPINAFVPLEVIFRFGVPAGSSLLTRSGNTYTEGQLFEAPLIEFTTKFDSVDKILNDENACLVAGLNSLELIKLKEITVKIAKHLHKIISSKGLVLWDGKLEFAFEASTETTVRNFVLVDSVGLDELRISYENFPLSKEILRMFYKKSEWYEKLCKLKNEDELIFRDKIEKPFKLRMRTLDLVAEMYQQTQELICTEKSIVPLLDNLKLLIEEIKVEYTYYR